MRAARRSNVPDGDYYIHAIPFCVPCYLPTFYGDVIFWENATVIHLGTANNPYNIHLVAASLLVPGNGTINGQINVSGLKSTFVDQVTMLLMNSDEQGISFEPGTSILGIGHEEAIVNHWSVYPNPVTDKLTVEVEMRKAASAFAEISDMKGRLLFHSSVLLNNGINILEISTSAMSSGVYSLRLYSIEGMHIMTKVVKTR